MTKEQIFAAFAVNMGVSRNEYFPVCHGHLFYPHVYGVVRGKVPDVLS